MIYIKHGSIFDEKADLIVLPCSSNGSVTPWVSREIEKNKIPLPSSRVPFGKVFFYETNGKYRKSDGVGFAASVNHENKASTIDAIKSILQDVIRYCREHKYTLINIPAFGTGAGGLDHSDVIATYKEMLQNEAITVNVYLPDRSLAELFDDSNALHSVKSAIQIDHPRVFISYAWGDEALQEWIKGLVKTLCDNGVDAKMDFFHLGYGNDLPQWMTDEIIKAQKVLLICDKNYAEKADTRKAGVGWETMIIQGDMLYQGKNNKYIAIACDGFDKGVPIYMKSKLSLTKQQVDDDVKTLLMAIYDISEAPSVKDVPDWIKNKMKQRLG